MNNENRLKQLLAYVLSEHRVCPMPIYWKELWEMLPRKRQVGLGWDPPLPLILAAWGETSPAEKRDRFVVHIRYAADKGVLDTIDKYIRRLKKDEWHYDNN